MQGGSSQESEEECCCGVAPLLRFWRSKFGRYQRARLLAAAKARLRKARSASLTFDAQLPSQARARLLELWLQRYPTSDFGPPLCSTLNRPLAALGWGCEPDSRTGRCQPWNCGLDSRPVVQSTTSTHLCGRLASKCFFHPRATRVRINPAQ